MSAHSGYAMRRRKGQRLHEPSFTLCPSEEKPSRVPEVLKYRLAILDRSRTELQSQLDRIERETRELRNALAEVEQTR